MVEKFCFTSQGQPRSGSRKRAITTRRSSSVWRFSRGFSAIWMGPRDAAKGLPVRDQSTRAFNRIGDKRRFGTQIPDSHKVYYGKFIGGGIEGALHAQCRS